MEYNTFDPGNDQLNWGSVQFAPAYWAGIDCIGLVYVAANCGLAAPRSAATILPRHWANGSHVAPEAQPSLPHVFVVTGRSEWLSLRRNSRRFAAFPAAR
jgi:hypothetical protein